MFTRWKSLTSDDGLFSLHLNPAVTRHHKSYSSVSVSVDYIIVQCNIESAIMSLACNVHRVSTECPTDNIFVSGFHVNLCLQCFDSVG